MVHDDKIFFRASKSMTTELDAVIAQRRTSRPHEAHSRASVIREALSDLFDREASPPAPVRIRQRPTA